MQIKIAIQLSVSVIPTINSNILGSYTSSCDKLTDVQSVELMFDQNSMFPQMNMQKSVK